MCRTNKKREETMGLARKGRRAYLTRARRRCRGMAKHCMGLIAKLA